MCRVDGLGDGRLFEPCRGSDDRACRPTNDRARGGTVGGCSEACRESSCRCLAVGFSGRFACCCRLA
jgi:hypothetical protein